MSNHRQKHVDLPDRLGTRCALRIAVRGALCTAQHLIETREAAEAITEYLR